MLPDRGEWQTVIRLALNTITVRAGPKPVHHTDNFDSQKPFLSSSHLSFFLHHPRNLSSGSHLSDHANAHILDLKYDYKTWPGIWIEDLVLPLNKSSDTPEKRDPWNL